MKGQKKLTVTEAVTRINCVYSQWRRLNEALARAKSEGLNIQFSAMPPHLESIENTEAMTDDERKAVEYYFLEKGSNG